MITTNIKNRAIFIDGPEAGKVIEIEGHPWVIRVPAIQSFPAAMYVKADDAPGRFNMHVNNYHIVSINAALNFVPYSVMNPLDSSDYQRAYDMVNLAIRQGDITQVSELKREIEVLRKQLDKQSDYNAATARTALELKDTLARVMKNHNLSDINTVPDDAVGDDGYWEWVVEWEL